jgi:hypothetical protein
MQGNCWDRKSGRPNGCFVWERKGRDNRQIFNANSRDRVFAFDANRQAEKERRCYCVWGHQREDGFADPFKPEGEDAA